MKYLRFLSVLPLLLLVIAACKVSDAPTNSGGNTDITMINTTVAGVVNDDSGQPLQGVEVTVRVNGVVKSTAVTNKFGSFMIQNASVPSSRCVILCKKNGYFNGSRAEVPNVGGITEMRLTMQSNATTHTVNASTGGKITVGTASINFPSGAFVTSTGAPYTGTVNVSAKFLDPTLPTFYNSFAGDMTATRTDGSLTELLSYGVLRVLIKDGSGNELKLANGKTATLSYPLAASMQQNAPASMPLWYFDETLGMWKEEGSTTKTGNMYTGEVAHFSEWNCDYPDKTGTVKGRVTCNSNEGVSGIYVTVGERKVVTDSNGYFSRRVPMNIDFTISINATENITLTAPDMKVTALAAGETRTLDDIKLTACPATITGAIVDCNSAPAPGTLVISRNGTYSCYFTTTGSFKIRVPSNSALLVESTTLDGKLGLPVSVPVLNSSDVYPIGNIPACDNGTSAEFYDINYGSGYSSDALLSPDGSIVAVYGFRGKSSFTEIYEVKTGTKLSSFGKDSSSSLANFTADGSKLLLHWGYDSLCVVNPLTGEYLQKIRAINGRISPDGSTIVAVVGVEPMKMATFSVATGTKIQDLSFTDPRFLTIIGLRGSSQIILGDNVSSNTRIITWDFISDTKASEITIPNISFYSNSSGVSPDGSILAFQDIMNLGVVNFYNTGTGSVLNASPFSVPGNEGRRQETSTIGVSNDNNFVVQGFAKDSVGTYLPPTSYSIADVKLQKVLATSSQRISFFRFNYSSDSRYLVGVPSSNSSAATTTVRVWKVK